MSADVIREIIRQELAAFFNAETVDTSGWKQQKITEQLYSAKEAAEQLKVTKMTILRWVKAGLIPAFKVGFGIRAEWRIKHDDLMLAKIENTKAA